MPQESPELVAKKRLVVNEESYYSAPRKENNDSLLFEEVIQNSSYFAAPNVDKLRVAVGKNWDIFEKQQDGVVSPSPPGASFSNSHEKPQLFYDKKLTLVPCPGTEPVLTEGSAESFSLLECVYEQRYLLKTDTFFHNNKPARLESTWAHYVKTGIIKEQGNVQYEPIVRANKWYFDHHFHGINPFTPGELEKKQTFAKTFSADYSTFYNERLNSEDFEAATGGNPSLQNSLPSIYSFLKLLLNKEIAEKTTINLHGVMKDAKQYYQKEDSENYDIYKVLLKKDALEVLLTLYGIIGASKISESLDSDSSSKTPKLPSTPGIGNKKKVSGVSDGPAANTKDPFFQPKSSKIVEKILTTNFDNPRIDQLSYFETYFNEYTDLISKDERLQFSDENDNNRILALERAMTFLVFSPSVLSILKLTDKYKKYFPYYAEVEFTANLQTGIGDALRDMYLSKVVSEMILASPKYFNSNDSWLNGLGALLSEEVDNDGLIDPYFERKYVEFSNEVIYDDLSSLTASQVPGEISSVLGKKSINFPVALEYWLGKDAYNFAANFLDGAEGIYYGSQKTTNDPEGFSTQDLRNYLTYFKDDFTEPVNINDDNNVIFKKLFGSALYAKIFNLYKENIRTFDDILNGKPAYTEDLFYRIEKTISTDDQDGERVVQNVLIPNTSDLDIVNYVDTQLKYSNNASNNAIYRYNVYAHKIVFGSRYKYQWTNSEGVVDSGEPQKVAPSAQSDGETGIMIVENDVGAGNPTSYDYMPQADFKVIVEPSIVLVEDKIFSTPEVIIIDKPPVMPDINIIPYRGISNRVKFLMTGATGKFRMKPVTILESDEAEFDKILRAQMSSDGKVEFASDDAAKSFQIFRMTERPSTFADFELYDQITDGVYEEMIQPNRKYYYTFRVIDTHGHVSNPTAVYEVELIDEQGAVKPIIRTIDMTPARNKKNTKDCQKYIYLKPTLQQLYFSGTPGVDSLFSSQTSKKRYKMRMTSKSSGKKIDIDFSFRKNFIT